MAGPAVPVYDPGGKQRTTPRLQLQTNEDMFGAAQGRALQQVGQGLQRLGAGVGAAEDRAKSENDTTLVTKAITDAQTEIRNRLYGQGGVYENRNGVNANGVATDAARVSQEVQAAISETLKTPEQKAAFTQSMLRYGSGIADSATKYEFEERAKARIEASTAALGNLENDVVAHYKSPELLKADIDLARGIIRANNSDKPKALQDQLVTEGVSALHTQVVQRLAIDDPGAALDYYKANKAQFSGADHAQVNVWIEKVAVQREVSGAVDEAITGGDAANLLGSMFGVESGGEENPAAAVSSAGALGTAQLMPDTARSTAAALGLSKVAQMSDEELAQHFATAEGNKDNMRIGATYLGQQLRRFNGDVEAALIAYNAGPENAVKFLNAGRDYTALPKESETLPHVLKVVSAWTGADVKGAKSSADLQAAIKGGGAQSTYKGDASAFLKTRLQAGKNAEHIDAMQPVMRDRLASLIDEAPPNVKAGLGILSGARTIARQKELFDAAVQKYGSVAAARKHVAPPGRSQHNHGNAADLSWNGGAFANAPKDVIAWVHENAGKYGLKFPMSWEPWHIETKETRGGGAAKTEGGRGGAGRATTPGPRQVTGDVAGFVTIDLAGNPAGIYTNSVTAPYKVDTRAPDMQNALDYVRELYKDNPDKLAEAERQIANKVSVAKAKLTAAEEEAEKRAFAHIINGGSMSDLTPDQTVALGPTVVERLQKFEDRQRQGDKDVTDEKTYVDLLLLPPEELARVKVTDYLDRLSKADAEKLVEKQQALKKPTTADSTAGMMQTRTQIMTNAANMLGLDTNEAEGAQAFAKLNRVVDRQVLAWQELHDGKMPNGAELQEMVDTLLIEGEIEGSGLIYNTSKRVYELTPEEASIFQAAQTIDEIPPEAGPSLAQLGRELYGRNPDGTDFLAGNEEKALELYNDIVQFKAGATPNPPADVEPLIRRAMLARTGVAPSPEDVIAVYRKTLLKVLGK